MPEFMRYTPLTVLQFQQLDRGLLYAEYVGLLDRNEALLNEKDNLETLMREACVLLEQSAAPFDKACAQLRSIVPKP